MTVWPQGVLVRYNKGLFKALGTHNVAVPGDSHHSRFFVSNFYITTNVLKYCNFLKKELDGVENFFSQFNIGFWSKNCFLAIVI